MQHFNQSKGVSGGARGGGDFPGLQFFVVLHGFRRKHQWKCGGQKSVLVIFSISGLVLFTSPGKTVLVVLQGMGSFNGVFPGVFQPGFATGTTA